LAIRITELSSSIIVLMGDHQNGLGAGSGNIVSMVWLTGAVGEPGGRSGSIREFERWERCGNVFGSPEPAELSTGRRRGEAAHPLHLPGAVKNDQIAAID
jgi:hypothetical protein